MADTVGKYPKVSCNGCKSCALVCPVGAIGFETDDYGFWYPYVDEDTCVGCGACVRRCPNKTLAEPWGGIPRAVAAWSNDDSVRMASTSGGVFYELARRFINSGGYVVGCEYDEDFKGAHHSIAHSMEEILPLMVSKYVESDMGDILRGVRDLLEDGSKVLFVGSPCQCAGLASCVGEDHRGLYLVDFICRGANSPKAHKRYVEYLERIYGGKITHLRSKDKRNGWERFGQSARFDNGAEYFASRDEDLRVVAYHRGNLMVRESCLECKFKGIRRHSDLTLGDYWGIRPDEVEDIDKGVSLVLVNTKRGASLLAEAADTLAILDKPLDNAIAGNPAIVESATASPNRETFLSSLDDAPFDMLVKRYQTRPPSIARRAIDKLRRILGG